MNRTQPQHRAASTLSRVPFTTGNQGDCLLQPSKSQSLGLKLSPAQHQLQSPLHTQPDSASLAPAGREASGFLMCTVCRRTGSQSRLKTQKHSHSTNSSVGYTTPEPLRSKAIVVWRGWGKTAFRCAKQTGRRKASAFPSTFWERLHLQGLWTSLCS